MVDALLNNSQFLVAINELVNSEVYRNDELYQMSPAFYHVLYGWLKLAFRFFDKMDMKEEVDNVQVLTLNVMSNHSIIRLIWDELEGENRGGQIKNLADVG